MSQTVVCQNHFHRGTTVEVGGEEVEVDFEHAEGEKVAKAEVSDDVAAALVEQDAYELAGDGGADSETENDEPEPVTEIEGIGPANAEYLDEAGIETVPQLADADAEEVGEHEDLDEEDVSEWIGRAKARQ